VSSCEDVARLSLGRSEPECRVSRFTDISLHKRSPVRIGARLIHQVLKIACRYSDYSLEFYFTRQESRGNIWSCVNREPTKQPPASIANGQFGILTIII